MLDFLAGTAEHVVTVTGKLTDATGCGIGVETRLQQPIAGHEHYPLGIRLVRSLARDVLHVLRIGQQDIKTFLLKEEIQAYPLGTCRLHRHCGDATGLEP